MDLYKGHSPRFFVFFNDICSPSVSSCGRLISEPLFLLAGHHRLKRLHKGKLTTEVRFWVKPKARGTLTELLSHAQRCTIDRGNRGRCDERQPKTTLKPLPSCKEEVVMTEDFISPFLSLPISSPSDKVLTLLSAACLSTSLSRHFLPLPSSRCQTASLSCLLTVSSRRVSHKEPKREKWRFEVV